MKRLLPIVLVVFMVLTLLSGCTKDPGGDTTTTTTGSSGSTDTEKVTPLDDAKVSIILSQGADYFASVDSDDQPNAFHRTFTKWKERYNTDVTVTVVAWDSFTAYLATAAASDQMPDVCYGGPIWFPNWPENNLVQPLDEYLDLSDPMWNKEIMDQLVLDGKHYVAFGQRPEKFYIAYNATKFEQAGETTPLEHFQNGTWTWTQFVKTCKNMTNMAQDEYGFTGWGLSHQTCIYPVTELGTDGKFKAVLNNKNTVRWLTEVSNLYRSGAARTEGAANWNSTFPNGKDAMVSVTPEEYIRFKQYLDSVGGDELMIAPHPVFDPTGETQSITTANVYGLSMTSKTKNPKAAAELIRLYYETWNSINDSFGVFGLMENYLSAEEKTALLAVDEIPVRIHFTQGIGNAKALMGAALDDLNDPNKTTAAQTIIDSALPMLEAEINEFYKSLG